MGWPLIFELQCDNAGFFAIRMTVHEYHVTTDCRRSSSACRSGAFFCMQDRRAMAPRMRSTTYISLPPLSRERDMLKSSSRNHLFFLADAHPPSKLKSPPPFYDTMSGLYYVGVAPNPFVSAQGGAQNTCSDVLEKNPSVFLSPLIWGLDPSPRKNFTGWSTVYFSSPATEDALPYHKPRREREKKKKN